MLQGSGSRLISNSRWRREGKKLDDKMTTRKKTNGTNKIKDQDTERGKSKKSYWEDTLYIILNQSRSIQLMIIIFILRSFLFPLQELVEKRREKDLNQREAKKYVYTGTILEIGKVQIKSPWEMRSKESNSCEIKKEEREREREK